MDFLLGLVVLVVGLLASVALHELGHMVPAKMFGVRVSQFMVGFGPTLWSRVRGETEYGFKGIPLGGYVRLIGMYPPAESLDRPPRRTRFAETIDAARKASAEEIRPGEDHRAFYRLSTPKKVLVMAAGTFTNLLVAGLLLAVIFSGIGVPGSATTTVAVVGECVTTDFAAACSEGDEPTPAAQAGLQPGDTIVSWGGVPVTTWDEVRAAIAEVPGQDIPVVVERDGEQVALTVSPVTTDRPVIAADGTVETDANGDPVLAPTRYVGFSPTAAIERQPVSTVVPALGEAVGQTVMIVATLPVRLWDIGRATLGLTERDSSSVVGLVGVARFAGEIGAVPDVSIGQRINGWLSLLASLNVALFVFNLVPLVPLDGGHVAGALWEGARRGWARLRGRARPGPSDVARMVPLAYGVFAALVVMTVVLVIADIAAPVTI